MNEISITLKVLKLIKSMPKLQINYESITEKNKDEIANWVTDLAVKCYKQGLEDKE